MYRRQRIARHPCCHSGKLPAGYQMTHNRALVRQEPLARAKGKLPNVTYSQDQSAFTILRSAVQIGVERVHGIMQTEGICPRPGHGCGQCKPLGITLDKVDLQSLIAAGGLVTLIVRGDKIVQGCVREVRSDRSRLWRRRVMVNAIKQMTRGVTYVRRR